MGFIEFWKGSLSRYKVTLAEIEYFMLGNDHFG